jgi:hypothetical protein
MVTLVRRDQRPLTLVSIAAAVWGLCYALYRSYYALGGTLWLPGTLADATQFRRSNAAAVVILTVAAVLPVAVLPLWRRPRARVVLLGVCWLVAVGCSMHALIDIIQRVLNLAGLLRIESPATVWASIDHRTADLQDLFFNEPWFLLEGLGFGALGWIALGAGRGRRLWVGSAIAATLALTVIGLLSATGVIGRVIIS